MQFIDTHCHIHQSDYKLDREEVYRAAQEAGVTKMICVGTDLESSREAIEFSAKHKGAYPTVGLHPHEAKNGIDGLEELILNEAGPVAPVSSKTSHAKAEQVFEEPLRMRHPLKSRVVAIGECGLDYFYEHSPREAQIEVFNQQIELAVKNDLPLIFHVREALDDFWPIFDNFHGLKGVLHSFTGSQKEMEKALSRDLLIGVNGISTFTKQPEQQQMFANIPLENLLIETDAPFLTPTPHRGKINTPAYVVLVAQHIAKLKQISLEKIASVTSENATRLFKLS